MKRFVQILFSFLAFAFVVGTASNLLHEQLGIPIPHAVVSTTVLAFTLIAITKPRATDIVAMDVEVEVWVDYIVKKFRKANGFLANFYSDDQYVVGGKRVHIPQPGSDPTTVKNPTSFPLTASQRADTTADYDLDLYATNPTHLLDADQAQISYDKMDSIFGEHLDVINNRIAEEHLIKSLNGLPGATNVIYTTGGNMSAKISGQTGTRKIFLPADLKKATTLLALQNVPMDDNVYGVLDANSLDELTQGMEATQWNAFNQYYDSKTGRIGRLYGVNIFQRSSVAVSAAALSSGNLAVNAFGAATGATDIATNLVYHKNAIARAMGEVQFYEDKGNPLYLGDIYNASVRYGGSRRYTASTGVIGIAQGT